MSRYFTNFITTVKSPFCVANRMDGRVDDHGADRVCKPKPVCFVLLNCK